MEQYHYIYKITDTVTGQYYIGMRSCNVEPELDSYMGSGDWIRELAMIHGGLKKHPKNGAIKSHFKKSKNIIKEIVEHCGSRGEAAYREEILVGDLWCNDELCMNKIVGGYSGFGEGENHPNYDSTKYHMWNHNTQEEFYATSYQLNKMGIDVSSLISGRNVSGKGICLYENKHLPYGTKKLENHYNYDPTEYRMWNHNTQEEFYITKSELRKKYNVRLHQITNVNCFILNGISTYENRNKILNKTRTGNLHCNYDPTKYRMWNHTTQTEFVATSNELRKLGIRVHNLKSGKCKQEKGVCLFEDKDKPVRKTW